MTQTTLGYNENLSHVGWTKCQGIKISKIASQLFGKYLGKKIIIVINYYLRWINMRRRKNSLNFLHSHLHTPKWTKFRHTQKTVYGKYSMSSWKPLSKHVSNDSCSYDSQVMQNQSSTLYLLNTWQYISTVFGIHKGKTKGVFG